MEKRIACQGVPGAFSHRAAKQVFPDGAIRFYSTFEAVLDAVSNGREDYAVLPVENSAAGRVADLHRLLGTLPLYVSGEHFLRIRHCLLGKADATEEAIRIVRSHPQALAQCRSFLEKAGYKTEAAGNTAMAAKEVAATDGTDVAAIASETAAELYGLKILREGIEDSKLNTTRFWILSRQPAVIGDRKNVLTSFLFWVKNKPAVLYKCLGGFATNGIDLLRLESYVDPERFLTSAGFLVDVAADGGSEDFRRAMDELAFFAEKVKILGTYPADPYRNEMSEKQKGMSV